MQVVGFLLLIAMLGVIVLSKKYTETEDAKAGQTVKPLKLAIVGRPNAGKSSLLNKLTAAVLLPLRFGWAMLASGVQTVAAIIRRGLVIGTLEVSLLREGVHSGDGSGVVASSFRVARHLLERLEDGHTGAIRPTELYAQIPRERVAQAARAAGVLGDEVWSKFPFQPGVAPVTTDPAELILNRTWRPALAITGADGIPAIGNAGNVMRPSTSLKLSLRVPPTVDAAGALARVQALLEADPPYGAKVRFVPGGANAGWDAPALAPWLHAALEEASTTHFGKPPVSMGEGGSIPFMGMLGQRFPEAQFFITGVLGPGSNAHGPNEFLDIPMAKKLTACVADVIARHATR